MIFKIILGIAAIFAIIWAIKTKKTLPTIITLGMVAGIVMTLFATETIKQYGFYVYMGFVALAFVFGLSVKNLKIKARILFALMSASIFVYWLWVLNHWHGNTLLFPIFALLVGIVAIFSKAKFKKELGIMILLAADAIAIIIENWMKAS